MNTLKRFFITFLVISILAFSMFGGIYLIGDYVYTVSGDVVLAVSVAILLFVSFIISSILAFMTR